MQSGSPLAFWAMSGSEWKEGYNINESDIHHPGTTKLKEHLKALDRNRFKDMKGRVFIDYIKLLNANVVRYQFVTCINNKLTQMLPFGRVKNCSGY